MSIYEYDKLPVLVRCNVLWQQGKPLKEGFQDNRLVVLSRLFDFYVEEHYSVRTFKLTYLYSFEHIKDASPITDI